MRSRNPVVQNALAAEGKKKVAMNKPYDIPMDASSEDKITVKMDEFVPLYGLRKARNTYMTFEKLPTYLARWGLATQEAKIRKALQRGEEYRTEITVRIPFVFSA